VASYDFHALHVFLFLVLPQETFTPFTSRPCWAHTMVGRQRGPPRRGLTISEILIASPIVTPSVGLTSIFHVDKMKPILLTLLLLIVSQPDLRAEDKPLHALEGTWIGHEIFEGGDKMDEASARGFKMDFQGNQVSVTTKAGTVSGTIQLDDAKNPKWMDIQLDMDGAVVAIPAIYEIVDGVLKVCHPEGEGNRRPTAFEVSDGVVVAALKRQRVEPDP